MRKLIVSLMTATLMVGSSITVASAHGVPGCPPATVQTRATPDSNFTVAGPAIVEVWYPDAGENGKPSWGNALRKVYVPGGITGRFFDAQGKTWKYVNNSACRHVSQHHFVPNPNPAVSRTTLRNQNVAKFWSN